MTGLPSKSHENAFRIVSEHVAERADRGNARALSLLREMRLAHSTARHASAPILGRLHERRFRQRQLHRALNNHDFSKLHCIGSLVGILEETKENRQTDEVLDELVKRIIAVKGDLDAKKKDGDTLLIKVIRRGRLNMFNTLLEHGASPTKYGKDKITPLMQACRSCIWRPFAQRLLQMLTKAQINARDAKGRTALHYAVFGHNDDLVDLLIRQGAKVGLRDKLGLPPLALVSTGRSIQLLVDAGANVNEIVGRHGESVLMEVIKNCVYPLALDEVISQFVVLGANVNATDARGTTALMHVVKRLAKNKEETELRDSIHVLLAKGAHADTIDKRGKTALDYLPTDCDQTIRVWIQNAQRMNERNKQERRKFFDEAQL